MIKLFLRSSCVLASSLGLLFTVGCSSSSKVNNGHLLAIGGAIEDDNAVIYRRFMQYVGDRGAILVVPTASADADAAIASKVKSLTLYRTNQTITGLNITTKTPELANSDATVEAINSATGLFFTGGDQSRITEVFRPMDPKSGGPVTTRAREAMFDLLRRGGCIAGTSAGAAMMSETMFRNGSPQATYDWYTKLTPQQREAAHQQFVATGGYKPGGVLSGQDEEKGVASIGPGMGFLQGAITDTHFIPRKRIGRLWPMMEIAGETVGIGISEDAAVDIHLVDGKVESLTKDDRPAAVLVVRGDEWFVTIMPTGISFYNWKPENVTFKADAKAGEQIPPRVNELTKK